MYFSIVIAKVIILEGMVNSHEIKSKEHLTNYQKQDNE